MNFERCKHVLKQEIFELFFIYTDLLGFMFHFLNCQAYLNIKLNRKWFIIWLPPLIVNTTRKNIVYKMDKK